ncbi:dynein axonemal heavy chain 6-like [Leuresthes tenuis]|uniref:dynein axonemal heavy chain 6-like n=1 Tax=Leuresthes tenuis TaxID=355514 RepID=UPI003B50096F
MKARDQMIFPGWNVQPHEHSDQPSAPPHPPPTAKVELKRRETQKQDSLQHIKVRQLRFLPDRNAQSSLAEKDPQPTAESLLKRPRFIRSSAQQDRDSSYPESNIDDRLLTFLRSEISLDRDEAEYTAIEQRVNLRRLLQIPFFALYEKWKCFYIWHTKVFELKRSKSIGFPRAFLRNILPSASQSLGPALREIRKMCSQVCVPDFCHIKRKHTYTLQEFQDTQTKHLEEVWLVLEEFKEKVKEVTLSAGRDYVLEHQSRSTDYLLVDTWHNLVVNAADQLLTVIQEQVAQTPDHAVIQSWSRKADAAEAQSDTQSAAPQDPNRRPLFISEMILDAKSLAFKPSEEDCQDAVAEVIGQFEKTAMSVKPLRADPDFDVLTDTDKYEGLKNKFRGGPSLELILKTDTHFQSVKQSIRDLVQQAFEAAKVYCQTFESFSVSSKEKNSLSLGMMRQQDRGNLQHFCLVSFEKALESFNSQHEEALDIEERIHFGLLLLNNTQLKDKIVTSSICSLQAINQILLEEARKKRDVILAEIREGNSKLELQPSTTAEMAGSLIFLDEIEDRALGIGKEVESVCKLYNLIRMYSLPMPLEDHVEFSSLEPYMDDFLGNISCAAVERNSSMSKFCRSLCTDMKELQHRVKDASLKVSDILSIDADSSQVRLRLQEVQVSIGDLQAQASAYASFQQKLKMEVAEFRSLKDLAAEFRLTQLLWDSLEEWDALRARWQQSTLGQLDPDQFSSQVSKYSDCVCQLETGLPPNSLVPGLKDKVEVMKQKLPVIRDLCYLCVNPEDWKILEGFLGFSLSVEGLTVAALEKLNIFSHEKDIQEVTHMFTLQGSALILVLKLDCITSGIDIRYLGPKNNGENKFEQLRAAWYGTKPPRSGPRAHEEEATEEML